MTLKRGMSVTRGSEAILDTRLLVIEHLGGTVPQAPTPSGWLLKRERQAKKLEERHQCFEMLKSLVCPWMTQVRELEIFRNGMRSPLSSEVQRSDVFLDP